MRANYILAHDLGTTGDKATLVDREGQVRASAFSGYVTQYPHFGWAEQNPHDWWRAVCASTRQLLADTHFLPGEIACVAFSGQMMGCVAVDRKGLPLREAIIWADQRAVAETDALIERVGEEEGYAITGHRLSPAYSAAKILWLRSHQPEIYTLAHKFLHAKDYIAARLTGIFVTDPSDASGTNLYDLARGDWSDSILQAAGLEREKLPEVRPSTEVVGELGAAAAQETGLARGTPVVIGGGDGCCAAVGAGVVREGSAYNYLGSSSWIGIVTPQPVFDPRRRTFTWAHMVPGKFHPMGTMQAAGGSYQWLRDVFCLPEIQAAEALHVSPYELMNQLAEGSPPGAHDLLFLPYLLGERSPRWNPQARGAYFGLTVQHSRADIVRATLEGITFNLRAILEALVEQGAQVDAMRVIGGGARGAVWRQILADIYHLPIVRLKLLEEATSMGAAIAGGIGVGIFPDFSVAERLAPEVDRLLPDPAQKAVYDRLYRVFNQCYEAFVPLYETLADKPERAEMTGGAG